MRRLMKAFAFLGVGKVGVIEKAIPVAGLNDAVIRTTASLICTSDVHTVAGTLPLPEGRVLGHESVGVVHAIGEGVTRFRVGDRVAVNAATPCGHCNQCQRGFAAQCGGMLGAYKFTAQKDGNLAEYFHVNDADYNLAAIPAAMTDEQALYATDMLSTGFVGAEYADIPIGGSVVIFAQGPVGLSATIGAKLRGAGLIIAVESKPDRAALARTYGADVVINPRTEDVVARVMELTGDGADAAIEALGSQETFSNCIKVIKPGGVVSNIGYHGDGYSTLEIPLAEFGLGMGDKTIRTALCQGGRERMDRLFRLIQTKRFDPTLMTTHRFSFDQVDQAFEMMRNKQDNIIKPLITF
ncbi:NAD(P)-dependent alcohol dehydrogenase [Hydrocarboniphaga effusa]|uniref:NAD(P)-dependent alcohol dehydrogenase n=1 Tax=Hydrocarboniphaga effusa TaxID=243629 RepID=UPI0035B072BA